MSKAVVVGKVKGSYQGQRARINVKILSQNRGYLEQPDQKEPEVKTLNSAQILGPWKEYAAWCKEEQEAIDKRNKKQQDQKTLLFNTVNGVLRLAGLAEIDIKSLYYQTDNYSFTIMQMQAIIDAFAKQQRELESIQALDGLDIF